MDLNCWLVSECRRRKQKCDGKTPCHLCTKRDSPCSYRSYVRQRGGRSSVASQNTPSISKIDSMSSNVPQITASEPEPNGGDKSSGLPRSMPPRLAIFNNFRATQDTSRGKIGRASWRERGKMQDCAGAVR